VVRTLSADASIKSAQPNYVFRIQQAAQSVIAKGDPAQYTLAKLRIPQAHTVTKGDNVLVAVIDSGVDVTHPELNGVIAGTFAAFEPMERPHSHGTAIAGAIAAQARLRLMGVAPAVRILAIKAFREAEFGAEGTSFNIFKGLEYAVAQNAQVINMSFAGPRDPLLERSIAAAHDRGIVLVAAVGNAGPNSAPLYPASDPRVIAVTATDSTDRLFAAAIRGNHIAVAAPGVDIALLAPEGGFQFASGTSFAARPARSAPRDVTTSSAPASWMLSRRSRCCSGPARYSATTRWSPRGGNTSLLVLWAEGRPTAFRATPQ
jgi:subtilisin family serine protease